MLKYLIPFILLLFSNVIQARFEKSIALCENPTPLQTQTIAQMVSSARLTDYYLSPPHGCNTKK